jgi:hypothetical protein
MLRFALPCLDQPAATDPDPTCRQVEIPSQTGDRDGHPDLAASRMARPAPRRHEGPHPDEAARGRSDSERVADGECPICQCDLEVHQPDEEFPERLLAICPFCRAWFVSQGGECIEIPLPR